MPSLTESDGQRIPAIDITAETSASRYNGYWQRLTELFPTGDPVNETHHADEPEHLWDQPLSRRRSLQLLAASIALAGATGCSRQPDEHILPYVRMPEHLVPGKARYYATASLIGGYAQGILAESHEGRPTKIEGNPDHPASLGACDSISQASVLSLYDPDRSQTLRYHNSITAFEDFLRDLQARQQHWDTQQGRGLCVLIEPGTSPSENRAIEVMRQRWPEARWFAHDAVERTGIYAGSEMLFGRPLEAIYHFDKAQVVVTLDADFMQTQPGFLRYARDFMGHRRPRDMATPAGALARLYALESTPSVTGAVADHRRTLVYPDIETAARQLAAALGIAVEPAAKNLLPERWVNALRDDLLQHKGRALVVPGDQQPAVVHALAHAINAHLGAFGETVEFIAPVMDHYQWPGLPELAAAIRAEQVEHLIILGANPVYTAPADLDFARLYQQIPWRLHWGSYRDESAQLADWHVPAAHPLETWADARAYDGTTTLVQPLIQPLYRGLSALQMLTLLTHGVNGDARTLLYDYWQQAFAETVSAAEFASFWRKSLQLGVIPHSAAPRVTPKLRHNWLTQLNSTTKAEADQTQLFLQFRPDPMLWDGRHANNGWLQEMPRPITTLTWGNALLVSPALAAAYELKDGVIVRLSATQGSLEMPIFVLPGQPENAVTLFLGQGRQQLGAVADGVGVSAYQLRDSQHLWAVPVALQSTGKHQSLAVLQNHHAMEGRDVIRATNLEDYRRNPEFAQTATPTESLYPEPWPAERQAQQAWGMSIDLSACIGCNSCITACQAENNIPVVGADEVARGHDMHWIRVDSYFPQSAAATGDSPQNAARNPSTTQNSIKPQASAVATFDPAPDTLDAPRTVFQPVPCMHCENAPCEPVCPVGATQHSADGLNEMIYQRCVGTRYCSQNCPYKVRRFNWFDYTGKNAAYPARPAVQNPNVTIRERGVMEKCTYCVQRIASVRQTAEAEQRPIAESELQTACQQTCPTQAIVFGDLMDKGSEVSRLKNHPLNYGLLEQLNTRPRTSYLAAVRNPNPILNDNDSRG